MLPGGLVAAALLLSLVPGWLFLRLTEKVRRPRHQSQLQEVLELVAVGVGTTGAAILLAALVRADGMYHLKIPPENGDDVRNWAWSVVLLLLLAVGGSAGVAHLVRKTRPLLNLPSSLASGGRYLGLSEFLRGSSVSHGHAER